VAEHRRRFETRKRAVTVSGERGRHPPLRAWQTPTGAHLKICQNYTHVFTPTVPSPTV